MFGTGKRAFRKRKWYNVLMSAAGTHKNKHKKILDVSHSGRLRPHKHTSYVGLAVVLALAFMPLLLVSKTAVADNQSFVPRTEQVTAVVAAPVPTSAPTIANLSTGQIFSGTSSITIQGRCVTGTIVEIFKNQVMGGAQVCSRGAYSIAVDLFNGNNSIIARAYNADGIPGPDSPTITVELTPPGATQSGTLSGQAFANQVFIAAEISNNHRSDVSSIIRWPLVVHGGIAPYTVTISWGDGTTDTVAQSEAGQFTVNHDYGKAAGKNGSLPVTVKATDIIGDSASLHLVAVFDSPAQASGVLKFFGLAFDSPAALRLGWILLVAALLVVAGFWVGERRELHHLHLQTRPATH
jgi:hypothetical protein